MKAAAELGVSYVTVLRRISALEDRLKTKLFDRHPTGYTLTPEGVTLRQSSERMEDTVRTFSASLKTANEQSGNPLPVSCGDGIGLSVIMRYLPAYRTAHPNVDLELRVDQLIPAISRREPRICFRPMRTTTPPGPNLARDRVGEIGFGVYASAEYLDRKGTPETPADLSSHDLLGGDESLRYVDYATWFGDNFGPKSVIIQTNSMSAILRAARSGLGLARLPHLMIEEKDFLVRVLPDFGTGVTELWILTPVKLARRSDVRSFIDHIVDSASRDEAWFMGR